MAETIFKLTVSGRKTWLSLYLITYFTDWNTRLLLPAWHSVIIASHIWTRCPACWEQGCRTGQRDETEGSHYSEVMDALMEPPVVHLWEQMNGEERLINWVTRTQRFWVMRWKRWRSAVGWLHVLTTGAEWLRLDLLCLYPHSLLVLLKRWAFNAQKRAFIFYFLLQKKRLHKLKCENSKAKPTKPPERWPVSAKDVHVRCKPVCMENTALPKSLSC